MPDLNIAEYLNETLSDRRLSARYRHSQLKGDGRGHSTSDSIWTVLRSYKPTGDRPVLRCPHLQEVKIFCFQIDMTCRVPIILPTALNPLLLQLLQ